MSLLTADELRDHAETDLVDDALTRIIEAADAEIIRRLGALASQVEVLLGGGIYIPLARRAASISSIVERFAYQGFALSNLTLAANDYSLLSDGYRIERLTTGTNASQTWNGTVTVTYVPDDSTAERKMLLVNLVKLDLKYDGHLTVSAGDIVVKATNTYAEEKAALFRGLASGGRRLVT